MKKRVRLLLETYDSGPEGFDQMVFDAPADDTAMVWFDRKVLRDVKVGDQVSVHGDRRFWKVLRVAEYEEGLDLTNPCGDMGKFEDSDRCLVCKVAKECQKIWLNESRRETERIQAHGF